MDQLAVDIGDFDLLRAGWFEVLSGFWLGMGCIQRRRGCLISKGVSSGFGLADRIGCGICSIRSDDSVCLFFSRRDFWFWLIDVFRRVVYLLEVAWLAEVRRNKGTDSVF